MLTHAQVVEIRTARAAGRKSADLALEYGISEAGISRIVHGKSYAHVRGPVVVTDRVAEIAPRARIIRSGPTPAGLAAITPFYMTPEQVKDLVRRAQQREFDTFVEGRDKQAGAMRQAWAGKDRPPSRESQRRRQNRCSRCSRTGHNAGRAECPPP
jgi:hypothetical protein